MPEEEKQDTAKEEKEEKQEEAAGEDEVDVVINTRSEEKAEDDKETEEESEATEEQEKEAGSDDSADDGQEAKQKERVVDHAALLENAKAELRTEFEEKKTQDEKKFTKEQIRQAVRLNEQKYADKEIEVSAYLANKEALEDLNEERLRREMSEGWEKQSGKNRAEENIAVWARQNAPELLDRRSKQSREAESFGKTELGAVFDGDQCTLPSGVARALFSLAGQAASGEKEKEAEERGKKSALAKKTARDQELDDRKRPPKSKDTDKSKDKPLSDTEKDVVDTLGLSKTALPHYREFKKNFRKMTSVEVN